ncbi:MAG: hypothetical protein ACRELZ_15680 [Candidatus Rokuibacteriota bacterium]
MAITGDKDRKTSEFWTTLPGILTGIAALVTAITGLTLGLLQYGVLGSKPGEAGKPPTSATAAQGSGTATPGARVPPTNPAATPPEPTGQRPTVVITASDGTTTTLFAENFRQTAHYDAQLHLRSGQAVAFDNIKSIDVVKVYAEHADIRIALVDDKVIDASLGAGSSIYGFGGENEVGTFGITVDRLKRVVFRR